MATIVAARGDPGEDRWKLFDSYYRTIYDRERQKAVPPYDAVLSKHQSLIDRLHHDIGFLLQFYGESSSNEAVSISKAHFRQLVDSYLAEDGYEGSDRTALRDLVVEAAHERLIFLTSRTVDELSFEVRSLQEYMAAECLMNGEPGVVRTRLRAVAATPYWRNVFLFAAGNCFADVRTRHLQDAIRVLCVDLDDSNDGLVAATYSGADLALDVLQSGAGCTESEPCAALGKY